MAGQAGFQDGPASPYVSKLASALSDFNNSLASNRSGSLAQVGCPGQELQHLLAVKTGAQHRVCRGRHPCWGT